MTHVSSEIKLGYNQRWRSNPDNAAHDRAASRTWHQRNPAKSMLGRVKARAVADGLAFDLTLEELEALLAPMQCALTGLSLRWDIEDIRGNLKPSIDRIDSKKGYISSNVRVVCWAINKMKNDLTDEDFFKYCDLVLQMRRKP